MDIGRDRLLKAEAEQEFPLIIATMPATARQRTIGFGVIILLILAAAAIAPFASIQLPQVNAFIPVLQTVVSVADPEARFLRLTIGFDGHPNVLLSVQDSGRGIPAEDQDRIFDPFFTTKSGGTGLGLAICSTVVANHGGSLRLVKSDSDGSIFEIAIPVGRHHSAE